MLKKYMDTRSAYFLTRTLKRFLMKNKRKLLYSKSRIQHFSVESDTSSLNNSFETYEPRAGKNLFEGKVLDISIIGLHFGAAFNV